MEPVQEIAGKGEVGWTFPYRSCSLAELAERIVEESDTQALRELHDHRTVFRTSQGQPMLLAGFVERLCQSPWAVGFAKGGSSLLDRAYDLTIDKFGNLPPLELGRGIRRNQGPDCRKYLQIFLDQLAARKASNPSMDALQEEMLSARLLQARVATGFRLSCLEARRLLNPTRSRYAWKVDGIVVRLWMPTWMSGRRRRAWLEENVGIPRLYSQAERRRIQQIVDDRLGNIAHFPLDEQSTAANHSSQEPEMEYLVEVEIASRGLARVVADEKVDNIAVLRPAIQSLGVKALRRLIERVFEDLSNDQYEERRIAESFGISAPTFSRFAGHRWPRDGAARPPDLWINVARVVAGHTAYAETAKEAGVWPRVQSVLHGNNTGTSGGRHG